MEKAETAEGVRVSLYLYLSMHDPIMKTLPSSCLLVFLVAAGCGQVGLWNYPTIRGSGTILTEERPVAAFDHVSLAGSGRLTIIQGNEERLTVTADDNLLEHIESVVTGKRLRIGPEQVSLRPSREIQYVLHLKDLRRLDLAGSLHATAESLSAESIALHISGSGTISIGTLEADHCEAHISGSGRVELAGRADSQELRVSGSGDYRAADLWGRTADLRISGSGNAKVWVTERLDTSISGSGTVSYHGTPKTVQSVSGSGKVRGLGPKEHTGASP